MTRLEPEFHSDINDIFSAKRGWGKWGVVVYGETMILKVTEEKLSSDFGRNVLGGMGCLAGILWGLKQVRTDL